MGFKNVSGKLGNMRKSVSWVLYPQKADKPHLVIIQSDKRIAEVNLDTAKAMLSDGNGGHPGFMKLSPALGAKQVEVPADLLAAIKAHVATNVEGDGIGQVRISVS
jgi:hypothetical protein